MRVTLILLVLVTTFAVCIHLERPFSNRTPPNERSLNKGELNPILRKIGDAWPVPTGTPIWFHSNQTSFATILEIDGDSALIAVNAGGSNWVQRRVLEKAWIEDVGQFKPH